MLIFVGAWIQCCWLTLAMQKICEHRPHNERWKGNVNVFGHQTLSCTRIANLLLSTCIGEWHRSVQQSRLIFARCLSYYPFTNCTHTHTDCKHPVDIRIRSVRNAFATAHYASETDSRRMLLITQYTGSLFRCVARASLIRCEWVYGQLVFWSQMALVFRVNRLFVTRNLAHT